MRFKSWARTITRTSSDSLRRRETHLRQATLRRSRGPTLSTADARSERRSFSSTDFRNKKRPAHSHLTNPIRESEARSHDQELSYCCATGYFSSRLPCGFRRPLPDRWC